ncbi:glycosyltransferase family 2 protein [Metasolibacillus fluoroglycofenilyticus]|uniref:glycosyltransferase family 2 protein n=1 Tax=Metasolibacillus fluoroglycofenilyticus TaxID=1239396 RepID=UPI00129080E9|nr:glycosyltransferase [Metasolibacillus fluoroglycofenilyticus]
MEKKVSVILLTYNHEKYISQAIESILIQKTNFDFEILIGDDCSTDRTFEVLSEYQKEYPEKIKIFRRESNGGATANYYKLLKESKGEFIAPLEGDDYWLRSDRLQILVDFLEENVEYVCVSHKRERRDLKHVLLGYDPDECMVSKRFSIENFLVGERFSLAGVLYRNFILNSGDTYKDYIQTTRNVADFQMCMCLLNLGPTFILNEVFGTYRVRKGENESNYNSITTPIQQYKDYMAILNATEEFFNKKYDFFDEKVDKSAKILFVCLKNLDFKHIVEILKSIKYKRAVFKKAIQLLETVLTKGEHWNVKKYIKK